MNNESKPAALHKTPVDVRKVLSSDATTRAAWKDLTPLARNEWISRNPLIAGVLAACSSVTLSIREPRLTVS